MKTVIEPFRIKMVEQIRTTTQEERERLLEAAGYNLFLLRAEDVTIDLLTDSGTSAMSSDAWAAMMRGDESYAGAKSWYRLESVVRDIFGFKHVVPTHQGRAAERILFGVMADADAVVPNNTHFDTTRANVEARGAHAVDLPCRAAHDFDSDDPFKGNMDSAALKALLETEGDRIPLVMLTVTNNASGGQPVSMQNIRTVSRLARNAGKPLYLDACRFAENAYFIKMREPGYANTPVQEIALEMFSYADGCTMSAKKDGIASIGGFLCTNDDQVAQQERDALILTEGFPTYGGMAGRDLEAIAVGLREVLDERYLAYRVGSVQDLVEALRHAGIPVVHPGGGHAVYLDARRFFPHLEPLAYPGQALAVELYREAGIRGVEIGTVMYGFNPQAGTERPAKWDLVRLALPRRVYTRSHLDYVLEAVQRVWDRRSQVRGMRIVEGPPVLRHFSARFTFEALRARRRTLQRVAPVPIMGRNSA